MGGRSDIVYSRLFTFFYMLRFARIFCCWRHWVLYNAICVTFTFYYYYYEPISPRAKKQKAARSVALVAYILGVAAAAGARVRGGAYYIRVMPAHLQTVKSADGAGCVGVGAQQAESFDSRGPRNSASCACTCACVCDLLGN